MRIKDRNMVSTFPKQTFRSIEQSSYGSELFRSTLTATHMRNMFALSKPSTTPQVQVPSTQQVVPSTPRIVPPIVEKPVIQEFIPPALNKFRQPK